MVAGTAFASMGGCTTGVRMAGTSSGAVMRLMGGWVSCWSAVSALESQ